VEMHTSGLAGGDVNCLRGSRPGPRGRRAALSLQLFLFCSIKVATIVSTHDMRGRRRLDRAIEGPGFGTIGTHTT
jgi:hypothetical protein